MTPRPAPRIGAAATGCRDDQGLIDAGFEIRHEENLREHYGSTLADWSTNLEEHWEQAVAEVGIGRARVWRLYMAACALGFERGNIQLHQVLGVRLAGYGGSGFPLRGWR